MAQSRLDIIVELETRGLKKGTLEFQREFTKMSNSASKQSNKVKGSNIALVELGRGLADFKSGGGLQDFSRGIIGSTNNVERFIEIMANTSRKSGGWGKAFKGLGKSFLGSGGILLGITLLVSYGPELFKFFKEAAVGADTFEESLEKLNKTLGESPISVEDYLTELQGIGDKNLKDIQEQIRHLENLRDSPLYKLTDQEKQDNAAKLKLLAEAGRCCSGF